MAISSSGHVESPEVVTGHEEDWGALPLWDFDRARLAPCRGPRLRWPAAALPWHWPSPSVSRQVVLGPIRIIATPKSIRFVWCFGAWKKKRERERKTGERPVDLVKKRNRQFNPPALAPTATSTIYPPSSNTNRDRYPDDHRPTGQDRNLTPAIASPRPTAEREAHRLAQGFFPLTPSTLTSCPENIGLTPRLCYTYNHCRVAPDR
ncbi:hypothetical protein QC764_0063140 [Podospora pseudoanserina]|uniref:Uncharacterized protein n=1 Tax=Podospora pseudoanserina TaxID=2609844 RepID=A0ABR0I8K9_9PEZI|nr:hypothetical protein QC764_0063140 [Podospora pseudoanserina]